MSQYSIADTKRVYNMAAEYVDETQRYIRMCQEADPHSKERLAGLLRSLDAVHAMLVSLKVEWQDVKSHDHNPDWDVT